MATQDRHATLDAFWASIKSLSPASPKADFEKYSAFIAPNATLFLNGMSAPPVEGPEAALEAMQNLVQFWSIAERRVLSRSLSGNGKIAVVEMDNHLTIMGDGVEHFPETEVVEFDDKGLIAKYRLYCDPKPIMDIVAKKMAAASGQ